MKEERIKYLKTKYRSGMQVELIHMEGEEHMPKGLKGKVFCVDDIGQVHVEWQNGSTLAINVEQDAFKLLKEPQVNEVDVENEMDIQM